MSCLGNIVKTQARISEKRAHRSIVWAWRLTGGAGGGGQKVHSLPRKFFFGLGFGGREPGMSQEFMWDVPDTWGCSKSLREKFGLIFRPPSRQDSDVLWVGLCRKVRTPRTSLKRPPSCSSAGQGHQHARLMIFEIPQTSGRKKTHAIDPRMFVIKIGYWQILRHKHYKGLRRHACRAKLPPKKF